MSREAIVKNYVRDQFPKGLILPTIATVIGYFLSRQNLLNLQCLFTKNKKYSFVVIGISYLLPQIINFKIYHAFGTIQLFRTMNKWQITQNIFFYMTDASHLFTPNVFYLVLKRLKNNQKNISSDVLRDYFNNVDLRILQNLAEKEYDNNNKLTVLIEEAINFFTF